jgi:exopolysaccharide biosynthesis glucuronosyltransferase PssE
MIFVTVGTNEAPFDRLLLALAEIRADEELVVQHGSSAVQPPLATCVASVSYEELVDLVRRARVVVSHAGVGSVLTALANGKRPIVVPRLRRFREAVDDHQLLFARRLEEQGLVTLVEDPAQLSEAVRSSSDAVSIRLEADRRLVDELRAYVRQRLVLRGGSRGTARTG